LEGPALKKLNSAVDRFAYNHPRFGIPNLMKYVVAGNVIAFLLLRFSSSAAVSPFPLTMCFTGKSGGS